MSLLTSVESSDEEEESEDNQRELIPLPKADQAEATSLSQVGALLSQVSEILQTATGVTTTPRQKVQRLKVRLKEISPKFSGGLINFELPVEMTRTMLKQVPEITPEFTKVSFKVQKSIPARTAEEMADTEKTMVEISKKLAGAATYLLSTMFPKDQKGHLPKTECIFRALCLTMGAIHQLQIERHADGFIRRALATTTETADVPDAVLEMQKQFFFPKEAGGGDPSSHTMDETRPGPRPIFPTLYLQDATRDTRRGSPQGDRSRSRTPPHQRAEHYRQWRTDGWTAKRKMLPPNDGDWRGPSPPGQGRRKY
jgi:hypothetical protein